MIFKVGTETERIQGSYISPEEIDRLTSYVESNAASCTPYYLPAPDLDQEARSCRSWDIHKNNSEADVPTSLLSFW